MFISVVAYHILHMIENRLRANGDRRKWTTHRNVLSTHERLIIGYKVREEAGRSISSDQHLKLIPFIIRSC